MHCAERNGRNSDSCRCAPISITRRGDWVDEPENGYQSDLDLLIVVSHKDLTEIADYWYVAEDRILRDPAIARPVNIIVHSIDEVNQALKRGEYFWVDIARDGIALYELPGHALATPMSLTPADASRIAQDYFDNWFVSADRFLQFAKDGISKNWNNEAAFQLHQATERLYICFLLTRTHYFPLCRVRHNGNYAERQTMPSGLRSSHISNSLVPIGSA